MVSTAVGRHFNGVAHITIRSAFLLRKDSPSALTTRLLFSCHTCAKWPWESIYATRIMSDPRGVSGRLFDYRKVSHQRRLPRVVLNLTTWKCFLFGQTPTVRRVVFVLVENRSKDFPRPPDECFSSSHRVVRCKNSCARRCLNISSLPPSEFNWKIIYGDCVCLRSFFSFWACPKDARILSRGSCFALNVLVRKTCCAGWVCHCPNIHRTVYKQASNSFGKQRRTQFSRLITRKHLRRFLCLMNLFSIRVRIVIDDAIETRWKFLGIAACLRRARTKYRA